MPTIAVGHGLYDPGKVDSDSRASLQCPPL